MTNRDLPIAEHVKDGVGQIRFDAAELGASGGPQDSRTWSSPASINSNGSTVNCRFVSSQS
jgi:hypothetical protein